MSTNFYLVDKKDIIKDRVHIGKHSNKCFMWAIKLSDSFLYRMLNEMDYIVDEYDKSYSWEEFWEIIRQCDIEVIDKIGTIFC